MHITNFSPPEPGKRFMSIRALLKVADPFIYQPDQIVQIIRSRAPEHEVSEGNDVLFTYRLGDLFVILADGSFILRYTPYTTATSMLATSETIMMTDPMTFGSIFTSYSFVMPTSTPGMTAWPTTRSTKVIIYSKYM